MENIYQTIVTSIISSAAVSGILLWLLRTWISERLKNAIKHEYDQKIETHKAILKSQADIEIERLKSQLTIEAERHNVRFSRVFDEIAETVAGVYERIVSFHNAVGIYVGVLEWNDTPSKKERREAAAKALNELLAYYKQRKLYLPKTAAERVEHFYDGLYKLSLDFLFEVEIPIKEQSTNYSKSWKKANDYMAKEAPPLLAALEDDFRNILGTNID